MDEKKKGSMKGCTHRRGVHDNQNKLPLRNQECIWSDTEPIQQYLNINIHF